jgi:predicted ATP-grasp superfamily ATP-dependent carboligase
VSEPRELSEPWLVAAWPGMGVVGLVAVTYLAKRLGADPLGELGAGEFFDVDHLSVKDGLFQAARRPRAFLFGWRAPPGGRDLVLLVGEGQPAERAWTFSQAVVAAAAELDVRRLVTFAAMAAPIDPRATPRVFCAASDAVVLGDARAAGARPLGEGEVSGLNGVLVGAGGERGIPGLCLLGEFPFEAGALPNPRASAAILRVFARLAGIEVDLSELDAQADGLEERLVELHEQAGERGRSVAPETDGADELHAPGDEEGVDAAARARLEALFDAARTDRARAHELKAELDRLGLFREYEDRFLDLFRRAE